MNATSKFPRGLIDPLYLILFLVHFGSTIQQRCPSHCACSLENDLPSLKCDQLPHLDQAIVDVNILKIENSNFHTCSVSEDLSRFPQLKKLHVSHCSLDIGINSFKKLPALQSITFHNVSLNHINPTLFESNRHLESVNLSSNPLRIGRHLMISASVEQIDLTNCNLRQIPASAFSQILNLKYLNLSKNYLKSFKNTLPNTVTYLDLSHNQLEGIPFRVIQPLENLTTLNVLGNPLICSYDLKLIDKYLSLRNVTFLRPDTCLVALDKEPIKLEDISIEDLRAPSELTPHPRFRRRANLEKREIETVRRKYHIKVDNPLAGEFIDLSDDMYRKLEDFGEDDDEATTTKKPTSSDESTSSAAEEPTPSTAKPPLVSKPTYYVLIVVIFILLILLIAILIAICLAIKNRCQDDGDSAASQCAIKACQEACTKGETSKLMSNKCSNLSSRRCSSRKGTTCRICPSTMSRKKSAMSDFSCKTASQASCSYTPANCENLSDTETVTNDECDFTAANSANTSACTTFQRC